MNDAVQRSDQALMSAYKTGDLAAFDDLYARYRLPLARFIRRHLGSEAAALVDEVFQDVWLRLVQAKDTWVPEGASFRTWLFTLAHNRAIDVLRKSGREVQEAPIADGDNEDLEAAWKVYASEGPSMPSPHDAEHWREAGARLLKCMERLTPVQRGIFLLRYDDGMSVEQAADALGVGYETAKARLRAAVLALRPCMADYLKPPPRQVFQREVHFQGERPRVFDFFLSGPLPVDWSDGSQRRPQGSPFDGALARILYSAPQSVDGPTDSIDAVIRGTVASDLQP